MVSQVKSNMKRSKLHLGKTVKTSLFVWFLFLLLLLITYAAVF